MSANAGWRLLLGAGLVLGLTVSIPAGRAAETPEAPEAAQPLRDLGGQVAIFDDIHVAADEVRRGDLVAIFGDVLVEGEAANDVVVLGGNLTISGHVRHDAVAVLSSVRIEPGGSVGHSLVDVLGSLEGRGKVRGDVVHIPLPLLPSGWTAPFGMIGALLAWGALLWTLLTFLLLLLAAALAPNRVRVISEEAPVSLFWAFLAGIGGYAGIALVTGILAMTVIGIPVAVVAYLGFIVLKWLGLAGIYHRIGTGLARSLGRDVSLLGAILLGFLPFALLQLVPLFFGGVGVLLGIGVRLAFWMFVEIPAVGLVLVTRAGGRAPGLVTEPPVTATAAP